MILHVLWELATHVKWAGKKYECEDGHALITDNNWMLLCPPNEEIISRSPSVLKSSLSLSMTPGKYTYILAI